MTENKPIIINRVDVSKCAYYDEDTYFTCQACNVCKCSELPNCYFKQLARKTQECEELKKQLTDFMNGEYCANGCTKMQTQYKEYHYKLIKENDQLKVENEEYKKNGVDLFEQLNNGLKANEKLKAQNEQAEQKLEHIRELAIVLKNICPYITIEGNDSERAIDEILQIISEGYNSLAEDCTSELDTPSASQIIDEVE